MSPVDPGYVPVATRLLKFRADHPLWSLVADLVTDDGQRIVMRASVYDEDGRLIAVGHAEESRHDDFPMEKCETSVWGRVLANLGYEVVAGIASAEEMSRVRRSSKAPDSGRTPVAPATGREPGLAEARSALVGRVRLLRDEEPALLEELKGWLSKVGLPPHASKMNTKQIAAVIRQIDRLESQNRGAETTENGEA